MFLFVGLAADLYYTENIVAFIGPGCTHALDHVARLAGYWNIPIVTGKTENTVAIFLYHAEIILFDP